MLDDQIPEKEEWEEEEEAGEEAGDEEDWRRRKRKWAENAAVGGGHRDYDDPEAIARSRKAAGWGGGVRPGGAVSGFVTAEQRLAAKMTTAEKLAAAAAAGTAGFRSAGSHMEQLKQNRLDCQADEERVEKRARHDVMVAKVAAREQVAVERRAASAVKIASRISAASKPGSTGAKSNKREVGQGSLMSYFAPKPLAPKEANPKQKTATEVIKQTKGKSLREQMEALPQPKFPVRPDNGGVVLLSSSPVRARVKKKERTPSPPSSPVFMEFCRTIEEEEEEIIKESRVEVKAEGCKNGSFVSTSSVSRAVVGQSGLSSTNVITTTAMAKFSSASSTSWSVPAAQPRPPGAGAGVAKKRTLGIRRSMDGWQNRASAKRD